MSGVSIRKMKEKLCNFLFREHVSALPSATAAALLPRSDLGDEVAVVIADRSNPRLKPVILLVTQQTYTEPAHEPGIRLTAGNREK